jgi:Kef-type K+ transport system membrane component KefB
MSNTIATLLALGGLFLLGLLTDAIGRHTPLPRVTLLLIFGFIMGPEALGLLTEIGETWFPLVADMALVMVGFLLGGRFTVSAMRQHGRPVLWISLSVVLVTALIVLSGTLVIGLPLIPALMLAGIATATDPAATVDVVHEANATGEFPETLLGIVAVDDAWGLVLFSILASAAGWIGGDGSGTAPMLAAMWEVGGAVLVGAALGVPMAYLTGRVRPGEPTLVEALGIVFLCGGIALWLEVSFLLAAMVLGAVVANLATHHTRPFHAVEDIEWPFMILFFVLAGAALRLESLPKIGWVGCSYLLLRFAGRYVGAWTGGLLGGISLRFRRWMGMALMPQAGVAMGMALIATDRFPAVEGIVLPIAIGGTVFFEILGPVLTRLALRRSAGP